MRGFSSVISIVALILLSACNETILKNLSNPNFDPTSCGELPISYASVNSQIFIRNCTVNGCHSGSFMNLTTYEGIKANLTQIKDSVLANRMPPAGPLAAKDKELLLMWINQGAPLKEEDAVLDCSQPEPDPEPVLQATYESLKTQVFAQNCLGCHGAGARIGDFASYEAITSPAQSDLFEQEHPERSEFVVRLVTEGNGLMPPPRTGLPRLAPEIVEAIKTWIANGMPRE